MALQDDLATYFLLMGYEWSIGGELVIPNEDDIKKVIDHAVAKVQAESNEDEDVQLEIGRLIFKKRDGIVDVFVLAGTIGEEE